MITHFKKLSACQKKSALLAAAFVLFLTAEILVRLILWIITGTSVPTGHPDIVYIEPHPVINYVLKRNYKNREFFINSQGFRNNGPIPDGIRIACVGAGTVFGEGIDNNRLTWTEQLQEILTKNAPKSRFAVINAGVPGYTLFENILDVELRILDYNPQWIILVADMDHLIPFAFPETSGTYFHYRRVPTKPSFFRNIFQQSALLGIFPTFTKPPYPKRNPINKLSSKIGSILKRDILSLIGICRHNNIRPILSTIVNTAPLIEIPIGEKSWPPDLREHFSGLSKKQLVELMGIYNQMVRRMASEYEVQLVDNARIFTDRKDWFDPSHNNIQLSPTGATRLAESFASKILSGK